MQFDQTKKYYVYAWYYEDTKKIFYIGKGTKYRYRSRKRDNEKLVEIINSNKCNSKILKGGLAEKEAFEYEKEMIALYKEKGHPLINIQNGGRLPPSAKGLKRTEETKKKMSDSTKDYYAEHPEARKELSNRMKNFLKTEKGREFQRKSIESKKNDDFRKKQSIICRKANQTEEYIKRQSEIAKNTWKSKEYTESHSGANNCRAQAVNQYDLEHNFIAQYKTMTEASKATGVSVAKISLAAKKERKTSGGYIWEYVNEKKIKQGKSSFVYDVNKDKNAKSVMQYSLDGEFIKEYRSIAEATRENNFNNRTNIIQNLKGKTKYAYGYVWKYKQDNIVPSHN